MKLQQLHIHNFRKLNDVTINLADASFLVGANNSGKSSTLDAIELLTSDKIKLNRECRSKYIDENGQEVYDESDIIIEGYFTDVPKYIIQQRGFNASRLKVISNDQGLSYAFFYRVRFDNKEKSHREIKMHLLNLKEEYRDCLTFQDFINKGIDASYFEGKDLHKKLGKSLIQDLENICPEAFNVSDNEEWFENPGGISGNVLSQLPRFLKIKADVLSDEMAADKSGTLHEILDILFSQVREASPNYKKAVDALSDLEKEMDTSDPKTEFGKLMSELNAVVDSVFHKASINVQTELTKPENLKARFSASLTSNVETPVERQGTGLIRATVFALLRYHKQREEQNTNNNGRGLIIGFEEPELFLHPNAAEKNERHNL
jgi:putative ATP-dependent endonuclease of OLD family